MIALQSLIIITLNHFNFLITILIKLHFIGKKRNY
jgi:hypothetical protein